MPTKEQLSKEVNEALGTNLEFDRMLVDDLETLRDLTASGQLAEPQLKQFAKKHGKETLDDQIEDWYPGKYALRIL